MIVFVNNKLVIPTGIGIAIIIVGVIVAFNQESKQNEPIDIEFGEEDISENPIITEKLDEIEKNAKENHYIPAPRNWQTSGPFQIDRSEYLLGEKIFLVIGGLDVDEKGQIAFLRPANETHYKVYTTIPFDGSKKPAFNYYVSPSLSSTFDLCTTEDIVGEWRIVFRGTDYPNIKFKIIDKVLPGDDFTPVC